MARHLHHASSDAPFAAVHYEHNDLARAQACLEAYRPSIAQDFLPLSVVLWHQLTSRVALAGAGTGTTAPALDALSLYADRRNIPWVRIRADWDSVALCLQVEALDAARALVSRRKLDLDEVVLAPAWWTFADDVFDPVMHATRYCIHTDDAAAALDMLRDQAVESQRLGRLRRLAKVRVLQSLAHAAIGDLDQAISSMTQALLLGHEFGLVRTFLDEGRRCEALLRAMDPHPQGLPAAICRYCDELLQGFSRASIYDGAASQSTPSLPGALTGREMDILRLISEGHSTNATGRQLRLSTNTVKWYLSQIYSKLGVNSRMQAIHRVRQQSLL